MDLLAHPAQVDVLAALDPTFVLSADQEDLPTTVSVITLALQVQLLQTTRLPALIAMLLVLLVFNIHPSVLLVIHAAAHSSTSNVLPHAQLELTQLTEPANTVLIAALLALDPILLAQVALLERFFTTVLVMINVLM